MAETTTNNTINDSETDQALAALLLAQAQSIRIENKANKDFFRRDQERVARVDAECDEAKRSRAPSRKRDREYRDACHETEHIDRMKKLQEQYQNENNTRNCTIERKNRQLLINLSDNVKEMESNIEYERNRQAQEASDIEFDNKEQTLRFQRQMESLKMRYEYAMETIRQREKEFQADVGLEYQQRMVANARKIDILNADLARAQLRLELGEKHGASLPDRLFE